MYSFECSYYNGGDDRRFLKIFQIFAVIRHLIQIDELI